MTKNIMLFTIALIVTIAMAGNAAAFTEPIFGYVSTTAADGEVVVLWVEDDRINNPDNNMTVAIGYLATSDSYYFEDIEPLLLGHGKEIGDPFNVTVAMLCDNPDTNTYHNDTGVTLMDTYGTSGSTIMPTMNIEPCASPSNPDLVVSDITVNYDASAMVNLAIGPELPGTRTQCNNISVNITELDGVNVGSGFDVKLEINGVEQACSPMQVPAGMISGSTVTVYCDCSFYPIAGVQYNISATVDTGSVIAESDEDNNVGWRNLTAITNGYAGNGWQDGRNISALPCYEQGQINLVYSHGDSYYLSGYYTKWDTYTVNWTESDLNIPPTDTGIKNARLYAYYHTDQFGDKWANLDLTFNGNAKTSDEHYSDGKGFGSWDYTSDVGVLVYNVTDEFVIGDNIAMVTNNNPSEPKGISMEAMVLVVVYENSNEPNRIIWINEGCDLISSKYPKYGVSPEEASTYAEFEGCEPISLPMVKNATLVSIAQIGNQGDDKNRLYFNGGEWHGLFPGGYVGSTNIGVHEANVKPYLKADDNVATYQDNGDMFAPANSFLIVEIRDEVVVGIDNGIIHSDPSSRTTLPITLYGINDYGTGTINLFYNPAIVDVTSVTGNADSAVSAWNKITEGHIKVSAMNTNGVSGGIVFANVEFAPTGLPAQCSDLNLTVDTLYDTNIAPLEYTTQNGSICIYETEPPVVTDPTADPVVILNDNGRARVPDSNRSTLSVYVTDDTGVSSVTVDLSPIKGPGYEAVAMSLDSGTDKNGVWKIPIPTNADHDQGVDSTHCLVVNATDVHGNPNTGVCITLTVLRRGDVVRDNVVNMGDALYIARYSVGLEPAPDEFVAGIVQADSFNGVDMGDALYIAKYTVGSEVAP